MISSSVRAVDISHSSIVKGRSGSQITPEGNDILTLNTFRSRSSILSHGISAWSPAFRMLLETCLFNPMKYGFCARATTYDGLGGCMNMLAPPGIRVLIYRQRNKERDSSAFI